MREHVPTILSYSRAFSVCYLPAAYGAGFLRLGLVLVACAALTDWADGYLARRWRCESEHGAKVDVYADKAFMWTCVGVALGLHGVAIALVIPCVAVFAYDVAVLYARYRGMINRPSRIAKVKTSLLFPALVALLAAPVEALSALPMEIIGLTLLWIAAFSCVWAVFHYFGVARDISIPGVLGRRS